MNILVDANVLIDVALARSTHADDSVALLDLLERGGARGFVAWHTPTTTAHLRGACQLPFKDFEDAMQVGAAIACTADYIATRNVRDFRKSPIPALTPAQIVVRLA